MPVKPHDGGLLIPCQASLRARYPLTRGPRNLLHGFLDHFDYLSVGWVFPSRGWHPPIAVEDLIARQRCLNLCSAESWEGTHKLPAVDGSNGTTIPRVVLWYMPPGAFLLSRWVNPTVSHLAQGIGPVDGIDSRHQ